MVTDIVGQEQDNLAQQIRFGDLSLTTAALWFQKIPYRDGGIYPVQKGQRLI